MARPREWDREALKDRLMLWAELPDSLNLNAFCCQPDILIDPTKLMLFVREDDSFRQVYNSAKAHIAVRREEANAQKELSNCAFAISHSVYDLITREEKREEMRFLKGLEKDEKTEDLQRVESKLDALTDHFAGRSKRKIDDKSTNS